jgi:hypothetical protein
MEFDRFMEWLKPYRSEVQKNIEKNFSARGQYSLERVYDDSLADTEIALQLRLLDMECSDGRIVRNEQALFENEDPILSYYSSIRSLLGKMKKSHVSPRTISNLKDLERALKPKYALTTKESNRLFAHTVHKSCVVENGEYIQII